MANFNVRQIQSSPRVRPKVCAYFIVTKLVFQKIDSITNSPIYWWAQLVNRDEILPFDEHCGMTVRPPHDFFIALGSKGENQRAAGNSPRLSFIQRLLHFGFKVKKLKYFISGSAIKFTCERPWCWLRGQGISLHLERPSVNPTESYSLLC